MGKELNRRPSVIDLSTHRNGTGAFEITGLDTGDRSPNGLVPHSDALSIAKGYSSRSAAEVFIISGPTTVHEPTALD